MKHPKIRVEVGTEPAHGSYVMNGTYQLLNGDTVSSGSSVQELFSKGHFRYQFLRDIRNPNRRSRICRCDNYSESEWLATQVDRGGEIVVALIG